MHLGNAGQCWYLVQAIIFQKRASCQCQPNSLKLHPPLIQRLPLILPKRFIPPTLQPIQPITPRLLGRYPLAPQHSFQLLIIPRSLITLDDPQKRRHRILRQTVQCVGGHTIQQPLADSLRIEQDRSAARSAVMTRHFDPVDIGLVNVRVRTEDGADFGGGDVLGFPAECVADAVAEPPPPFAVPPQNVSGTEICIPFDEHVTEYFTLGGGGVVEVPLELGMNSCGVDFVQQFPRLTCLDLSAEVIVQGVAERSLGYPIHLDNDELAPDYRRRQEAISADCPTREFVGAEIPRGAHAFGRRVEFADGVNTEALLKTVPDIWPETVAQGFSDFVDTVEVLACDWIMLRLRGEEIAASLADVLNNGSIVLANLVPEGGSREAVAEDQCTASDQ